MTVVNFSWEEGDDQMGRSSLSITGRPFLNCTSPPQECVVSLPHHSSAYQNFPRKRVWEWEFGKCHEWFRYCEHEGKPWQRRGYGLRIKGFISWAMEKEGFGKWGNDRIESLFKRCRVRIRVEKMQRQREHEAAKIAIIKIIIADSYRCPRHCSNLMV